MTASDPIRLDRDDLYSPRVEAYLEEQAVLAHTDIPPEPQPWFLRVFYSSWLYLSLAGMIGALVAWGILEPFFAAQERDPESTSPVQFLLFPTVVGSVGLFLGAVEGAICRNPRRAVTSALVGLGVGFVGGCIALVGAGIVFVIMVSLAMEAGPPSPESPDMPRGFGILLLMMGRGAAWAIAAIPAGIGQGIALRDRKVAINGLIGGVLGGLIGGLLFDPIYFALGASSDASLSRALGFMVIGILVGLFVGLVEQWTKTAWVHMKTGPIAGKQFVLFRDQTVIGSSPKADVYVFKDPAIEPRHAIVHNRGGRFEIEDLGTPDGTYVNGRPVTTQPLKSGDQIVVGKTTLEFALKDDR